MQHCGSERGVPYLCFQGCSGEEWQGLASAELSPAVALQPLREELLAPQRLPNSWPRPAASGLGEADRDRFLEKPRGSQLVSREVLLTITFLLQGCPVLPQTPGSSVACSRSWAVPRLRLHLARIVRCRFCWCRDGWGGCQHFHPSISSASQELPPAFASSSFRQEMLTLSAGGLLLHYPGSPVLVRIQASSCPDFSPFPATPALRQP